MTSPWGKMQEPMPAVNFAEVMDEQYAEHVQNQENARSACKSDFVDDPLPTEWENEHPNNSNDVDNDATIAQILQSQYYHEYNESLNRIEKNANKNAKVTLTLEKYRFNADIDIESQKKIGEENELNDENKDWDRFETNEKTFEAIPKCGFKINKENNGEVITKHNGEICAVRNACKVMSCFPAEFPTGDAAAFDMKLSNKVFNELHKSSLSYEKKTKLWEQRDIKATSTNALDTKTRLILLNFVNNQILENPSGIISTGKEAIILHADSDPNYCGLKEHEHRSGMAVALDSLPKECAVKVYKTTMKEFKQRHEYIKDDYRFKKRFKKQNNDVNINLWAEKEMHNLMRMKSAGLKVPDVIALKKHILVMSFIGKDRRAALTLKDAQLTQAELSIAYKQIIAGMRTLYKEAKLVHADLSEYNILWNAGECWFIDVAQSVEPNYPCALEFLMRDCCNIVQFFTKRRLGDIYTKEQLFEFITDLSTEKYNVAMLQRIHSRGITVSEATAPNYHENNEDPISNNYPFEVLYEESLANCSEKSDTKAAVATRIIPTEALEVLRIQN